VTSTGGLGTRNNQYVTTDILGAGKLFTQSCWYKKQATAATSEVYFMTSIKSTAQDCAYYCQVVDPSAVSLGKFKRTGTGEYDGTWHEVNSVFPAGQTASVWHYYALVWNSGTVQLYLDGALLKSAATDNANGTSNITTSVFTFGNDLYVTVFHSMRGAMDEYRLEDTAWSAAQVKNYYNFSMGRYAPKIRF
jgi:hypothetical protein